MNNLAASILLRNNESTMPGWANAERYEYCDSQGYSLLYRIFHR